MKAIEDEPIGSRDDSFSDADYTLYAPMIEWCLLRRRSGNSNAELRHVYLEFYRVLDQIVREEEFCARKLGMVLGEHWDGDVSDPEEFEHINTYCIDANAVRQYVEALGQVTKRGAPLKALN